MNIIIVMNYFVVITFFDPYARYIYDTRMTYILFNNCPNPNLKSKTINNRLITPVIPKILWNNDLFLCLVISTRYFRPVVVDYRCFDDCSRILLRL